MSVVARLAPVLVVALCATAIGVAVGGGTSACNIPNGNRTTEIYEPDFLTYKTTIDAILQRRCGTLDCHGQPGRAYRIHGFTGIRLPAEDGGKGLVSGREPTSEAEVGANFRAIIALEPEEMARLVARAGEDPQKLLFIRKAANLERHKGGPVIAPGDDTYACLTAWLRIQTITRISPDEAEEGAPITEDGFVVQVIDPADRAKLSDGDLDRCSKAEALP